MIKKTILSVLFTGLLLVNGFGQGEGNNWFFGSYAGLNFGTTPPTILNDGHLTTGEGCAAVSNKIGALLFYTDGTNVWDANHTLMPNGTGLFGNPSSTQSAVICPKPGTYNYGLKRFDGYYIVTIDFNGGPNGVRFSEVDMTLNGGMGDVLAANKNTLLFGTTTIEGANVARHANGCDYWIIGKEVGNNTFRVYGITSAGVNLTPVISNTGNVTPGQWGGIKVSPNNRLVTIANSAAATKTQVYDFNNGNGVVTFKFSDNAGGYSSEFSADNNILYSAILNDPNIYQYDLTAPSNAAFQASRTVIGTTANTNGYRMCALQMAPNGKIYAALQSLNYVGVINNPSTLGVGCNYVDNGQSIAGVNTFSGTNMSNTLGLPAFPSFFITQPTTILSKNLCFSDQTSFKLSDTTLVFFIEWTITDINQTPITTSFDFEPVFQFSDTGQYIISTIVHYPCFIDSFILDTVRIIDVRPIDLGVDTLLCVGDSIMLDAGTGYDHYIWSNGDTIQSIYISATSQVIVQVLMQSEDSLCEKSDTVNITAFPVPISTFNSTIECFGTPTNFTDVSNNSGGIITNWEWDFDNDATVDDTTQNPSFTFPGAGTFPVNLKVSTAGGACFHDTTINVPVNPVPTADFTLTDVCANDTAVFSDTSTISSGSIVSYAWDFGDGPPAGTSVQQDPSYVFNSAGTFMVVLTVTSDSGCADVQFNSIEIFPVPNSDFTAPNVCQYDDAVFTYVSTISSGAVTAWQWDFGDATTSTLQNPTHLYNPDNTYNVSLIVTSDNSCSDTIVQPIDIYPIPLAGFTTTDVCLYDPAAFTDMSSITSGTVDTWYWLFDDGNVATLQNPTHSYVTENTYTISLIASSNYSCVDTVTLPLTIHPVPIANFATNSVCLNDPATFSDASSINTGSIATLSWDFGDGVGTSNAQNPSYTYTNDGIFVVTHTATSDNNCVNTNTKPIEIYPLPTVIFTVDKLSGCEPLCVVFTDLTGITKGIINNWSWDFGDGNTSTAQNPRSCYIAIDENTPLDAAVTLTATSAKTCSSTLTVAGMIEVKPRPIGQFTAGPQPTTILAPAITFSDQSLGNIVSWSWDFGDSVTVLDTGLEGANPIHVYTDTGTYNVEQITKTLYLCPDTFRRTIVIAPDYIFHVPNTFTPNGDGINETFMPQGIGFDTEGFEMYIYDRWGDLIFETNDLNTPWDGRANNGGKSAQESVYVWLIVTSDLQGNKHKYMGHVTLLR